jgi:lactoylglutathione lyase
VAEGRASPQGAGDGVTDGAAAVSELRLVVTVPDIEAAVRLYRDVLGMRELPVTGSEGGHVVLLEAGRATLELTDPTHAAFIDQVEVGERSTGTIRIALEVDDVDTLCGQVADLGAAELVAPPTLTPWGSRNARFAAPGGVQLTLFGC